MRGLVATGILGFGVALACLPVRAQIFRCPDGNGVVLQQAPCPGLGQGGGRMIMLPNGQRAPVAAPTAASAGASDVPKLGRVLGRTPRPGSDVASGPN